MSAATTGVTRREELEAEIGDRLDVVGEFAKAEREEWRRQALARLDEVTLWRVANHLKQVEKLLD